MGFWQQHSDAVITGILVAAVTGGGALLWGMNSKVTETSIKVVENEKRLERIATALPEVRHRIALNTLEENFDTAFLSCRNLQNANRARFIYIDAINRRKEVWEARSSSDGGDKTPISAALGTYFAQVENAVRLSNLTQIYAAAETVYEGPTLFDFNKSAVGFRLPAEARVELQDQNFVVREVSQYQERELNIKSILANLKRIESSLCRDKMSD